MKKLSLIITTLLFCHTVNAADLLEVYQQALGSDPIYQQAISQRLATKEGVFISLSSLLPNIGLTYNPAVTRSGYAGANLDTGSSVRNNTLRSFALVLTATQTVFNFTQYMNLASQLAVSSGADAILNSALQNLMIRVSKAYFAVLLDEDNLSFTNASKLAYKEQLEQVQQQFQVGLKTITDVYTAQASYDSAVANYIAAETKLTNDRENLRVITGRYYEHLAPLSENFPLITPSPDDVETWVHTALQQNWSIKAAQYTLSSARQNIRAQFGGHLPTVELQGTMDRQYWDNINGYQQALNERRGPSTQTDRAVMVNMSLPIFSGGNTTALTNQATYQYEVTQQQLEQTQRNTVNQTRQSYYGVISGISQIKADRQAIKSTVSSLRGMEESYRVGAELLVNVLNQQQKVFEAQTKYATDRYTYVNNFLLLKLAAGTLGFNDLRAVNIWLRENEHTQVRPIKHYLTHKRTVSVTKKTKLNQAQKFAARKKTKRVQKTYKV